MTLFDEVRETLTRLENWGWCPLDKAMTMAAAVLSLRPEVSCEIGVYAGRSFLPMAIAHRTLGHGMAIGIDPWKAEASVEGQIAKGDKDFWAVQNHHELAFNKLSDEINRLALRNVVKVYRKRSDDVEPPRNIGVLSVDGNHGPQVLRDIERYAPQVVPGGLIFMDDYNWSGKNVMVAVERLQAMGCKELYRVADWGVLQKL